MPKHFFGVRNMQQDYDERDSRAQQGPVGRKPYERPAIISREPLEAMAELCPQGPPPTGNFGKALSGTGCLKANT